MPCDKLVLLTHNIRRRYLRLVREFGARGGYENVSPLRDAPWDDPVRLHCYGRWNRIHKIEFLEVAKLGFWQTRRLAEKFIGSLTGTIITRIDWCLDLDIPFPDVAARARLLGTHKRRCVEPRRQSTVR